MNQRGHAFAAALSRIAGRRTLLTRTAATTSTTAKRQHRTHFNVGRKHFDLGHVRPPFVNAGGIAGGFLHRQVGHVGGKQRRHQDDHRPVFALGLNVERGDDRVHPRGLDGSFYALSSARLEKATFQR